MSLVGGETVSNPGPALHWVSLVGEVDQDKCIPRRGATVGTVCGSPGELGGSIAGHHLDYAATGPRPWLAAHYQPSAMID
ncbi:MAG: hypothetical protein Ct9H300mP32_1860 [Verrucomicrobiota bacterium]|nr:MAG: hypothetical protein Ct9H300mP32_1860 [Verrucomicrobiota bacterium]